MEKNLSNIPSKPIIRVFDAPREKVWKAWTDPAYVKRWWGPKDFTAPYISIDLRVGGKFVYCMRGAGPDGVVKDWWNTDKHLEIVPMKKIVQSMSFADEHGDPVPASHYGMQGEWPMETFLTVTFEDADGGKTKITVREDGIPSAMIEMSRLGWEQSLDKFAESLK
jgi:uncharacterized protein YndB with AHSA1/START domain